MPSNLLTAAFALAATALVTGCVDEAADDTIVVEGGDGKSDIAHVYHLSLTPDEPTATIKPICEAYFGCDVNLTLRMDEYDLALLRTQPGEGNTKLVSAARLKWVSDNYTLGLDWIGLDVSKPVLYQDKFTSYQSVSNHNKAELFVTRGGTISPAVLESIELDVEIRVSPRRN